MMLNSPIELGDGRDDPRLAEASVDARVRDRDRLLALRRSRLLDSRQEEAFDRLTRRACLLIGVPGALVSLVDADRQFFKSAQGLREPFASARQTPLSHSFCRYVVAGERPLVVSDARAVPRLADSPAITDLDVIGYAGVPLCAHGFVLGAFCAIDARPHEWSDEELAVLHDLSSACAAEIHVRAALREGLRARGEQRFHALGDALSGPGHMTAHPLSEPRPRDLAMAPTGARDDRRRWQRPELAIPVEAVLWAHVRTADVTAAQAETAAPSSTTTYSSPPAPSARRNPFAPPVSSPHAHAEIATWNTARA